MCLYHKPVLLHEVMELLNITGDGVYVDATLGMGGHSEAILQRLGPHGRLISLDKDAKAVSAARQRFNEDISCDTITILKEDFSNIYGAVRGLGYDRVDAILLDLGMCMVQVKDDERGFSFNSDYPLDMRMDRGMLQNARPLSAWDVVNNFRQEKLEEIILQYGEESRYRAIAKAIVTERKRHAINTCKELATIVAAQCRGYRKRHPATKTFQALRIFVNDELATLTRCLDDCPKLLNKDGRLCVISYNSLEDRIVKFFFKQMQSNGMFKVLTKKPVTPGLLEIRDNPSSRSAKLRGGIRQCSMTEGMN
ncbi:MAG: 16S rRNA (cytosine(1402)-N(4))-methyltransferase RsmH [Nitrospirae bacterium]|nr:16S rRNA (cytosine(1402)-N(4))-methyltransferase RsmH [Nitrospirota bacterium]